MLWSPFFWNIAPCPWVIIMASHLTGLGPVMEAASFHILLFLCVLLWPFVTYTLLWVTTGVQPVTCFHFTRFQSYRWTLWPAHCPLIGPLYFPCQVITDPLYSHIHLLQHSLWIFWPLKMRWETTVLSPSGAPSTRWCCTTYPKSGGFNCTTAKA
jgi:hypothetical protein